MRIHTAPLAALCAALAFAAGDAGAQYSNAFVFGDSLGDAGQYGARFTTNPGLSIPMYVTQHYGIDVTPSFAGGTDFAQGGARVNAPSPLIPPNVPNLSIGDQVSQLLAHGPLDRNALYQYIGGGNDLFVLAAAAQMGQLTPDQLQAAVVQSATDAVTQLARLQAAGARYLVVYNVPNAGASPFAISTGTQATFTALSNLFDTTLNAGIAAAHLQVVQVNLFTLVNEIVANPAAFGFTNVTIPACTTASSFMCTPATLREPNAALTYGFADSVHPTTGFTKLAAQVVESMLEGPAKVGVLAEAPLAVERTTFRSIDGRMISSLGATRRGPAGRFQAWADYDYGNNDFNGPSVSGNADVNSAVAGGDMRLSDQLLIGVAFGYSDNKGDFGGDSGGYKLKETTGTAYLGYGPGPWYVGATLGAGDLDYSDVNRRFDLGALSRTESGDTHGWQVMGSVLGGYWFNYANWLHGPFVRFAYQEIHVDGYSERGSDSTALSYGEQERKSLVSTLGWQVSGQIGSVRPFARVAWELESKNDDRFVSATPVGLAGIYSVPTIKPDDSYASYVLGASTDFGDVTGYLFGSATSGRSDGNAYGVTVGVRVPL